MRALIEQMNAAQQQQPQATRNNANQNQFNAPQMIFYQAPYTHQKFMYPNAYNKMKYNSLAFKYQIPLFNYPTL